MNLELSLGRFSFHMCASIAPKENRGLEAAPPPSKPDVQPTVGFCMAGPYYTDPDIELALRQERS